MLNKPLNVEGTTQFNVIGHQTRHELNHHVMCFLILGNDEFEIRGNKAILTQEKHLRRFVKNFQLGMPKISGETSCVFFLVKIALFLQFSN